MTVSTTTSRTHHSRIGGYYRLTTSARVDCIGQLHCIQDNGFVELRVPNWTADGMDMYVACRPQELERSTAAACRDAARQR